MAVPDSWMPRRLIKVMINKKNNARGVWKRHRIGKDDAIAATPEVRLTAAVRV